MKRRNALLPMLILLAVFLYAAVNLIHYTVRSVSTKQTNRELQALYEQMAEVQDRESEQTAPSPTPEQTAEVSDSDSAAVTSAPTAALTAEPKKELLSSYQYIGDTVLTEMAQLRNKNPDLAAWLRIPNVVNLPVVYRDNTYYLDHDFYGRKIDSGTLFLDEAHPLKYDTQYMVVHGHNMHDGSMFGLLSHYRQNGYMEEHPVVYLSTLYRQETYEVIGVLYLPVSVQSEGYVPYIGTRKFRTTDQFYDFAAKICENALYWKEGTEMLPEDAFLALSTCHEDHRIVVMCRRIGSE